MRHPLLLLALLLGLTLLSACQTPEAEAVESPRRYRHTFTFVFEQAQAELLEDWSGLSRVDASEREIETEWRENLSSMSDMGRRDRLLVTFEGGEGEGWVVKAKQFSEKNTEQEEPLNPEEADWKATGNESGLAIRFLRSFDTRLNPVEPGARERVR